MLDGDWTGTAMGTGRHAAGVPFGSFCREPARHVAAHGSNVWFRSHEEASGFGGCSAFVYRSRINVMTTCGGLSFIRCSATLVQRLDLFVTRLRAQHGGCSCALVVVSGPRLPMLHLGRIAFRIFCLDLFVSH